MAECFSMTEGTYFSGTHFPLKSWKNNLCKNVAPTKPPHSSLWLCTRCSRGRNRRCIFSRMFDHWGPELHLKQTLLCCLTSVNALWWMVLKCKLSLFGTCQAGCLSEEDGDESQTKRKSALYCWTMSGPHCTEQMVVGICSSSFFIVCLICLILDYYYNFL